MKKNILTLLMCFLFIAALFCSCGGKKEGGVINTGSQPEGGYNTEVGELTAQFEGDWEVTGIYQNARVSDVFPDDGLATERTSAVHIGTDFYESCGYHYDTPCYSVQTVSSETLYDYGFTDENIQKDFGKSATMLSVSDGPGEPTNIVYFLYGDKLIKFGTGAHLYICTKVEAVG
ncbi:MAG: hypothetical protein IJL87_07065 [Clostridia bacterium]|nr:hypothetical protein [Clostridia bacterium]